MIETAEERHTFIVDPRGDLSEPRDHRCPCGLSFALAVGYKLKDKMSHTFSSLITLSLLPRCTADEPGQKAESEQQKICLNRASSVTALMRSRRSTSVVFDPPACGYGAASSAVHGHLYPELLH